MQSIQKQSLYPNEILIVDGSINNNTDLILKENNFKQLKYFKVSDDNRGLTKQRNFGISKIASDSEVVCFWMMIQF